MIISLENFDEHGRSRPLLNSPRSIQACKRQGIQPEQLIIKTMEQIKHLYKDGMNDRKSLQIKMLHYEMRRKSKLDMVLKERMDIIQNIKPMYRPNPSQNRLRRIQIVEVEDKLQKKKIMDEVKSQLKQKQLQMKNMQIQQKIRTLEQKKRQSKWKKEIQKRQKQKLAVKNQTHNQILHEAKINNYLVSDSQKQQQVKQALLQKQNRIKQINEEKNEFYTQKTKYAKQIEQKKLIQKKEKVDMKFSELDKRLQQKEAQESMYKRNLQDQRRKDELWKETKRKQTEIEEKKRHNDVWESIKHKQIKKESYLEEIQGKKQKYYNNKKQDREAKAELIKTKQLEDEKQIEKRRRIMELIQQDQKRQDDQKRLNDQMTMQSKKQMLEAKQKGRLQNLKQDSQMKQIKNKFIVQRQREKEKQIEEKKKQRNQKEKEKILTKQLKLKQTEENRQRMEKIKFYQKQQSMEKYHQKMNQIDSKKKQQKSIKIIKNVNRQEIEFKILSQKSLSKTKIIPNRGSSADRIQVIKSQARKNPIQIKEKLKTSEINKLIQNLKVQYNKQEYALMKKQEEVEKERVKLQQTAENVAELRRLQKIHAVERTRFQQKLTNTMKSNQQKVEKHKAELIV